MFIHSLHKDSTISASAVIIVRRKRDVTSNCFRIWRKTGVGILYNTIVQVSNHRSDDFIP